MAHATFELDLVGTAGRARLTEIGWRLALEEAGPSPRFPGYRELAPAWEATDALHDAVLHAVEDLVARSRRAASRAPPAPTRSPRWPWPTPPGRSAADGGARVEVEAP